MSAVSSAGGVPYEGSVFKDSLKEAAKTTRLTPVLQQSVYGRILSVTCDVFGVTFCLMALAAAQVTCTPSSYIVGGVLYTNDSNCNYQAAGFLGLALVTRLPGYFSRYSSQSNAARNINRPLA
jgi:hypothetical protein